MNCVGQTMLRATCPIQVNPHKIYKIVSGYQRDFKMIKT